MIQTKLFIGARVTPELKAHTEQLTSQGLLFIPYEGKEYIGLYIAEAMPHVKQLRSYYHRFIDQVQKTLPEMRTDNLPVVFFPQVLIG